VPDAAVRRILIDRDPFADREPGWSRTALWPARWVALPGEMPYVVGYRLAFTLDAPTPVTLHVTADERYELYLDGELIGRGSDRGDVDYWTFETYAGELAAGEHLLAARVWSLGAEAPFAQHTHAHGFLLAAEGADLDTGSEAWEAAILPGHGTRDKGAAWGCGLKFESDGRTFPWGWERGADSLTWTAPVVGDRGYAHAGATDMDPGRMLIPAILPAQYSAPYVGGRIRHVAEHPGGETATTPIRAVDSLPAEVADWQGLVEGRPLTVPANSKRRVLLDLDEYVCAYPEVHLRGGRDATVRVHWQEALFDADNRKGNRDEIEGKVFRSFIWETETGEPISRGEEGVGDLFIAGGGDERHSTLWWEAGRYVEIVVETADQALEIAGLRFIEDRYPLEDISTFTSSDPRLESVKRLGYRTLQMCAHETTMDCPFYEQLQYIGDTRLQCLVAYVTGDDDRLARQALLAFDRSRGIDGLTRSRYPSRVRQTIPTFSLWWVAMVHDFALWRGDLAFVADLMPGVRAVLDAYRRGVDDDGVFHSLDGWNFTDWVAAWPAGVPAGADGGVSGIIAFQLAFAARMASEVETWLGEPELAARHARLADTVLAAAEQRFWSTEHGLYADDLEHAHWSEHAQCLALLAGAGRGEQAVQRIADHADEIDGLARTTVYFDHYLFEAMGRIGRTDVILRRLGLWHNLLDTGLRTVVETPEPTRSDCHAWGAHPIFHFVATLLGVRPTSPGMATVRISPDLGGLDWAESTFPTPHGPLSIRVDADGVHADLPQGMTRRG
jgi:alpha-L-rhamnosidase